MPTNLRRFKEQNSERLLTMRSKSMFGVTDSCRRAGFILRDGSMLDFGEGRGLGRVRDHSDVTHIIQHPTGLKYTDYEVKFNPLYFFMEATGAVRFHTDIGFATHDVMTMSTKKVTTAQWKTLNKCCREGLTTDRNFEIKKRIYYDVSSSEMDPTKGWVNSGYVPVTNSCTVAMSRLKKGLETRG